MKDITFNIMGWSIFLFCVLGIFVLAIVFCATTLESERPPGWQPGSSPQAFLLTLPFILGMAIIGVATMARYGEKWAVTRENFDSDEKWEDHKAFVDSIT